MRIQQTKYKTQQKTTKNKSVNCSSTPIQHNNTTTTKKTDCVFHRKQTRARARATCKNIGGY